MFKFETQNVWISYYMKLSGTNVIFKNLRQICWLISGHPASSSFYHQFLGIVTLSKNKYTGVWSIKRLHSWNKENNQKPT